VRPLPEPGIYLARVTRCIEDVDAKGPYLDIAHCEAHTERLLCYDVLRFTPRATGIALQKLVQLGVKPGTRSVSGEELVGRRVWIALHHEEFQGVVRAKPDIGRLRCGYLKEEDGPHGSCETCGRSTWWRRRRSGLWICSRCCPPIAPASEIDEVRGG